MIWYSLREPVENNQLPTAVYGFEVALAKLTSDFLKGLRQRLADK